MRITNEHVLDRFARRHAAADRALREWKKETKSETWSNPHHVRDLHSNVRPIGRNRLIFNVRGNRYRLVVEVNYEAGLVTVRFIGTHAQYDLIEAGRV